MSLSVLPTMLGRVPKHHPSVAEIAVLLRDLRHAYVRDVGGRPLRRTFRLYARYLARFPREVVAETISGWIEARTKFPTVAELIEWAELVAVEHGRSESGEPESSSPL